MSRIAVLDSTLRDGAQGEGISFSVTDKINIVKALDDLGVDIIEAGNPGSNPKDLDFFRESKGLELSHATLAAFGSTRRRGVKAEEDDGLKSLLSAETPVVVLFGKSWDLHVTQVLKATLEENIGMIRDTVAFCRAAGRRVIYDAEHFFDGYKADGAYALATLRAAAEAGAECLVLCDTNGGNLPELVGELTAKVLKELGLPVGIHAHNDSGLAVANALASVKAGATPGAGHVGRIRRAVRQRQPLHADREHRPEARPRVPPARLVASRCISSKSHFLTHGLTENIFTDIRTFCG